MADSSNGKELSMEMRLLLAFILMGAVLFLTQYFYTPATPPRPPAEPVETQQPVAQQPEIKPEPTEPELALIRRMLLLPEVVEIAANTLEPHHLAYYAQELATVFHSFYMQCRVVTDDQAMTKARLKLVEAAKIVLARTLHLMGMTAPDKM